MNLLVGILLDQGLETVLLSWVAENRGRIGSAALTLLCSYHVAGRPAQSFPGMGSIEGWSDLVRSAVVFHGLADPGLARMSRAEPATSESDAGPEALPAFLGGLEDLLETLGGQATARRMVAALADEANRDAFGALRSALRQLYPELDGGLPTARQLGNTLRSLSGRVAVGRGGGWAVDRPGEEEHPGGDVGGAQNRVAPEPILRW